MFSDSVIDPVSAKSEQHQGIPVIPSDVDQEMVQTIGL